MLESVADFNESVPLDPLTPSRDLFGDFFNLHIDEHHLGI